MVTGDSQGPRDPAGPDPLVGRTLNGRFTILEPIGYGGMGRVYRALQAPLDRVVALKVLSPNFPTSQDPSFQRRFLREASLSSKLRHPNTVTVIDYGQTEDGIFYIAMEYLEGRTLAQVLSDTGALPWTRAFSIAQQLCRSLREAHSQGIVHRDLKPANVMLLNEADQDVVKVLDFGLVKSMSEPESPLSPEITQSGTFLGSPAYMAPEQARNVSDARSDVYSLGVLLYQMLAGRLPFVSRDHLELIFAHHKEAPPPFNTLRPHVFVPTEIEAVVRKCLEKDPANRYQTMDELLEAMRAASMAAGGTSGIFKRPGSHVTTGPHPTPAFAQASAMEVPAGGDTLAVDISVEVPQEIRWARWRMLMIGALVGGVIAAALTGGVLLVRRHLKAQAAVEGQASAVQAPAPASQLPTAPDTSRVVRFRLMSEPTGAHVFFKGEDRGTTPLVLEVPKEEGEDTITAEFTFELEGYQAETVITGGSGEVVFSQKLQPRRDTGGEGGRGTGSGGRAGGAQAPSGRVEPASGSGARAGDTAPALGSLSAPVMLGPESAAPAPGPEAAEAEGGAAAATAPAGSLAVPVPVLAQGTAQPTGDAVVPFQEGMSRPVELEGRDIVYTREALEAKIQGTMAVKCVITREGQVQDCRVLKGLPYMNEAVVQSLESRRFKPATLQGKPLSISYVFNIRLVLPRSRR
jgi:serine/threonine-protein kinase